MWPHFVNFALRCIRDFTSSIGTNPLGFSLMVLDSIASIAVSLFRIFRREGLEAMREHWKQNAWITIQTVFWVTLVLYGPFAIYGVVKCVYAEHRAMASQLAALQEYAKNKRRYDDRMKWAEGEAKHWQDAYERASRGETKPDRILSREEEDALYERLLRLAKDSRNKDYTKIKMATLGCDPESHNLAYKLWTILQRAHWDVPPATGVTVATLSDACPNPMRF